MATHERGAENRRRYEENSRRTCWPFRTGVAEPAASAHIQIGLTGSRMHDRQWSYSHQRSRTARPGTEKFRTLKFCRIRERDAHRTDLERHTADDDTHRPAHRGNGRLPDYSGTALAHARAAPQRWHYGIPSANSWKAGYGRSEQNSEIVVLAGLHFLVVFLSFQFFLRDKNTKVQNTTKNSKAHYRRTHEEVRYSSFRRSSRTNPSNRSPSITGTVLSTRIPHSCPSFASLISLSTCLSDVMRPVPMMFSPLINRKATRFRIPSVTLPPMICSLFLVRKIARTSR